MWERVPARVLAARARAILTVDVRASLRTCPAPILYMVGSHDRVVPRRNAEVILRELPTVQMETIEGPHLAMYTNPVAAATAITGFMRIQAPNSHPPSFE